MSRIAVLSLATLLAAGCADEGSLFVPADEPRENLGASESCLVDDLDSDGQLERVTRLVESDGGRTLTTEEYLGDDDDAWLRVVQHFDDAHRLLESVRKHAFIEWEERCFWVYDSSGRELGERCDHDGDGTYEEIQNSTAWNAAGQVTAARREERDHGAIDISRAYDARGRLLFDESLRVRDGVTLYRAEHVYHDDARTKTVDTITELDGAHTVMTYDRDGHRVRTEYTPIFRPELNAYTETLTWQRGVRVRTERIYASGQHHVQRRVPCAEVLTGARRSHREI